MKLRTAIIGMGKMGRIRKRELDAHPEFELIALCDLYENMTHEFPNLTFSVRWEDILSLALDGKE